MKKITFTFCAAFFLLSCNNETSTEAKVASAATAVEPMPDSATMQQRWMEYMTPGPMHQLMAEWNGDWTGEAKHWQAEGSTPVVAPMKASTRTILGGLYQESVYTGNFNGMNFEGRATMAYDNVKKVFLSTWIDNFGSGIMQMEGKWFETDKTISSTGKAMDPVKQKDCEIREVVKIIDKDTHLMEMYSQGADGKEFKSMEILMKRVN